MDLFLCWSGSRSKSVAVLLQHWLPRVLQPVKPWMSLDIEKGTRWTTELLTRLERSAVAIVCLTRENMESRWLHYEAGILTRSSKTLLCTFLLPDLQPGHIAQPLASFQHTTATRDDVWQLVSTIHNALLSNSVAVSIVEEAFKSHWPNLNRKLREIAGKKSDDVVRSYSFGDLASQMNHLLSKAGFNASSVVGGANIKSAPLDVQLSVERLLGELSGGFERLSREQRLMVYGGGQSALFEMARALVVEHRWEEATRYLDEYIEVNPADWRAHKWRGIAYAMSRGGPAADSAALEAYKNAIRHLPRSSDHNAKALLYNYRGSMFKRLGRHDKAEEDLKIALRYATENLLKKDIHYNLACVYALTGRRSHAMAHMREIRHSQRELNLVRSHMDDYFKLFSSDHKFLKLIGVKSLEQNKVSNSKSNDPQ